MDSFKMQADKLIYDFGLLEELKKYGTPHIVGSYSMNLMAWNDLDIYVSNETMSNGNLYKITAFILDKFEPVWYEAKQDIIDNKTVWFQGFETNILGELWNVDIWFFDKEKIAETRAFCDKIKAQAQSDSAKKEAVIGIKRALIENDEYGFGKYTSMDVYKAVFELGIRTYNEFMEVHFLASP